MHQVTHAICLIMRASIDLLGMKRMVALMLTWRSLHPPTLACTCCAWSCTLLGEKQNQSSTLRMRGETSFLRYLEGAPEDVGTCLKIHLNMMSRIAEYTFESTHFGADGSKESWEKVHVHLPSGKIICLLFPPPFSSKQMRTDPARLSAESSKSSLQQEEGGEGLLACPRVIVKYHGQKGTEAGQGG